MLQFEYLFAFFKETVQLLSQGLVLFVKSSLLKLQIFDLKKCGSKIDIVHSCAPGSIQHLNKINMH